MQTPHPGADQAAGQRRGGLPGDPGGRYARRTAVRAAGAYGFTMASNYNGRPRPAEVLVDGIDVRLVRRRETYEDLISGEV